jgi:UDP-GlcNAc:undecaprenyl-phosphate GlcNAc-1-phosphate transferase
VPPVGAYAAVGVLAAVVSCVATVPARRVAERVGFVAMPDDRHVHERPTPYGGGVAIFVAMLAGLGAARAIPALRPLFEGSTEPVGLVVAAAVAFGVGMLDDLRDMSAPAKVAGQVLAAMALVVFGVTMFQFKIPLAGFVVLSPQLLPLVTAVWVVGITNAVNLIDGLDGLAAGIVAIAAGALAVYGLRLQDLGVLPSSNIGPLVAVVTCGACVGFLPHNFHPAKVFMGDAGALLVGLAMAATTMLIGGRTPDVSGETYFFFAPLFIPLFILGVPLADMAFAFVRRTARGMPFDAPDIDHVHHRLMRLGHGHRRTVVLLWAWTAVLSGFVLFPLFGRRGNAVIPFGAVGLGLLLYTWLLPGLRRSGAHSRSRDAPLGQAAPSDAPGREPSPAGDAPGSGAATPLVRSLPTPADHLADAVAHRQAPTTSKGRRSARPGGVGSDIVVLAGEIAGREDGGRVAPSRGIGASEPPRRSRSRARRLGVWGRREGHRGARVGRVPQ